MCIRDRPGDRRRDLLDRDRGRHARDHHRAGGRRRARGGVLAIGMREPMERGRRDQDRHRGAGTQQLDLESRPTAAAQHARDQADAVAKRVPLGRIGEDEDMAAAAIYLASRAGDYVVGHTVVVDGGGSLARLPAFGPAGGMED